MTVVMGAGLLWNHKNSFTTQVWPTSFPSLEKRFSPKGSQIPTLWTFWIPAAWLHSTAPLSGLSICACCGMYAFQMDWRFPRCKEDALKWQKDHWKTFITWDEPFTVASGQGTHSLGKHVCLNKALQISWNDRCPHHSQWTTRQDWETNGILKPKISRLAKTTGLLYSEVLLLVLLARLRNMNSIIDQYLWACYSLPTPGVSH